MRHHLKAKLVDTLIKNKMIQTQRVADLMMKVDRGEFWGSYSKEDENDNKFEFNPKSYENQPQ